MTANRPDSNPSIPRAPRVRHKTLHAASVEEWRILLAQCIDVNLRDCDGICLNKEA